MRQRFIITAFLTVFLIAAMVAQHLYFNDSQGKSGYYFLYVYWICGLLIAIFTANLIWRILFGHKDLQRADSHANWANRRNTFRIIYPGFLRPVLVVSEVDHCPTRQLEFPVMDLSQGGSCFLDDGSLGAMESFSGHIRFNGGNRLKVSGKLIRKAGNQVSVQFLQAIDWSVLLNEQRRVLTLMKNVQ